jgi:ABC-2 type transport system ATP-binding protein
LAYVIGSQSGGSGRSALTPPRRQRHGTDVSADPTPVAIHISGLTKVFGGTQALAGVELDVRVGEIFGYLGPNGAGKTTTIRILLDLVRPTSGVVAVLGENPQAGGAELRRRIGFLPSEFTIYDRQSGAEALSHLAAMRGDVAPRRITELADRFELDLRRTIRDLSRGNRQKVGIVAAFMGEPELLILDEPTTGLDPLLRRHFAELLLETRAIGGTVFLSSHVLAEVQAVADRVGVIRAGRVVTVDTVAALRDRAVRRVEAVLDDAVNPSDFHVPNLTDVVLEGGAGHTVLHGMLSGDADALVKALARHRVRDLRVEEPDLEQIFLSLYGDSIDGGQAAGASV